MSFFDAAVGKIECLRQDKKFSNFFGADGVEFFGDGWNGDIENFEFDFARKVLSMVRLDDTKTPGETGVLLCGEP